MVKHVYYRLTKRQVQYCNWYKDAGCTPGCSHPPG